MRAAALSNGAGAGAGPITSSTILVVDDEPGVRGLVRFALERFGYSVLEAGDAREALRRAEGHPAPIQLMITDLGLPDADGRDLAARLSVIRPDAKVIFMSGTITLDAGETDPFLQKPFALRDLLGNVQALIDR